MTKSEGKYYGKVLYKSKCIPLAAVHLEGMTSSRCVLGDFPVRFDHGIKFKNNLNKIDVISQSPYGYYFADVEGYPIHMKHYWSKSYEDYTSKLMKWQNAFWFKKEYDQLSPLKFEQLMVEEDMNAKYDVDMLSYVDLLRFAIECVHKL